MANEMTRLAILLAKADIPFELNAIQDSIDSFSVQIVSPSINICKIDAVCHKRSYGGKNGLLEVWCDDEYIVPNKCVGWLEAEEAFKYFEKANV